MRTVTFADPKVVDLLNERFVVVWNNHNPDRAARGEQGSYSPAEVAAYPEGGGGNNLHTVIASSEGDVLHSLTGYWSAGTLLAELEFSLGLSKENARERRAARMQVLREEAATLARENPAETRRRIKDSPLLRRMAALELLGNAHRPEAISSPVLETHLGTFLMNSRVRVFV